MNTKLSLHGLETLTRQCAGCRNTLSLVDNFNRCSGHNRSGGWKATCKECELDGKVRTRRRNSFDRIITQHLKSSHEQLLNEALAQDVEETCPVKLRAMFPHFTDKQVTNMAKLNEKWNAANDFLIEEQSAWLDPSSRPEGGIEYREDLFGKPFAKFDSVDKVEQTIRAEQADLD